MNRITIANFYKFIELEDLAELQKAHQAKCDELNLRGTILLAKEGINANLGGLNEAIQAYCDFLRTDRKFSDIVVKQTFGKTRPFSRMKVKIKDHIVIFDPEYSLAVDEIKKGKRLSPKEWAEIVNKPQEDVVILDTRNDYELAYGGFKGSTHLNIKNFKDFPKEFLKKYGDKKDLTYVMCCTGGIRCEKAVAFAENEGFKNCYQLEGGIIKYFEEKGHAHWDGSCFVFDFRWAITPEMDESDDGHYLEDQFKGCTHEPSEHVLEDQRKWPPRDVTTNDENKLSQDSPGVP